MALRKIQSYDKLKGLYGQDFCGTKEPAAPFSQEEYQSLKIEDPLEYVLRDDVDIFNKYRTLYYVRNNRNGDLIYRMTSLLESEKLGALIKHEVPSSY